MKAFTRLALICGIAATCAAGAAVAAPTGATTIRAKADGPLGIHPASVHRSASHAPAAHLLPTASGVHHAAFVPVSHRHHHHRHHRHHRHYR